MLHHTTDPAQRAADIAEREIKIRRQGNSFDLGQEGMMETRWLKVYRAALKELVGEPEISVTQLN